MVATSDFPHKLQYTLPEKKACTLTEARKSLTWDLDSIWAALANVNEAFGMGSSDPLSNSPRGRVGSFCGHGERELCGGKKKESPERDM